MLGDKGYDADWFRNALIKRGIVPCIPSKANRKIPIAHDQTLYRQRHKIENVFGKLKDWRRIHIKPGLISERNCLAVILVFGDDRARTPPVEVIVQADANDMTVEAR